jgi:hypothetical protein
MTYQQLISTPCSTLSTMTYDAFRNLLNASYRELIILEARQKEEKDQAYRESRQVKIQALEAHIRTLCASSFYRQFVADLDKDIQTITQATA